MDSTTGGRVVTLFDFPHPGEMANLTDHLSVRDKKSDTSDQQH